VLRVMGASLALAGLGACGLPVNENSVPYVTAPESLVPGVSRYYATLTLLEGFGIPVLVETVDGRPIKVEGNPDHPLSRGATDVFSQAAVLDLYDPDRSTATTYYARIASWEAFQLAMIERAAALAQKRGEGFAILTGAITSPTTLRQMRELQDQMPALRWYVHEPVGHERRYAATRSAFGEPLHVVYRLDRADAVLALDADPLGPGPAQLVYANQWVERRRIGIANGRLPGLHVLESTPTLTGSKATSRWPASSGEIVNFTLALAQQLGLGPTGAPDLPLALRSHVSQVAQELKQAGAGGLVLAGPYLPSDIHALTFAINDRLGSLEQTVELYDPIEGMADRQERALPDLASAIEAGSVDTLVVLDSNPAYTAPADLGFGELLRRVPLSAHVGPYFDETAALCHWHVALQHPFETWSDARAVDGTASVIQPLLGPRFGGRSIHEVLAVLAGNPQAQAYDLVRETWRNLLPGGDFESAWRKILEQGYASGTAAPTRSVPVRQIKAPEPAPTGDRIEAVIRPDPSVWDGRFANNAWLQELPKPFTKLTWDNAVLISPALAEERELENGDQVAVFAGDRSLRAPVWVLPGQALRTVTLLLGYGRGQFGRVGAVIGYDAYQLRTTAEPWTLSEIALQPTGAAAQLASTQDHGTLAGHADIVRSITPEELLAGHEVGESQALLPSLYPEWEYKDYAWGMVIDMDACIGCNACVIACVAENNIPVVGKDQVIIGREMHWLKVDRYYSGPPDNPDVHWQPRPCMQCEKAPCEVGCPVNATVHGPEGLNQMIYNRCIGTRTCASYCPYKVRRFNYLDYTGTEGKGRVPQRNPDVTVRARGVMEKCTYCVQRISEARIAAQEQNRRIRDGEVVTACQQACPTRAIIFGDLNLLESSVAKAKGSPRNYTLLRELNTQPRTTYLAEVEPPAKSAESKEG
jgi:Fe-S-cluster-containing dehydrogenase component